MVYFKNIKIHFFLFNAGLACVIPYLPVHAKEIGINAFVVGLIYCFMPIVTMILKPAFGALADHFNVLNSAMKVFLCFIMLASVLAVSIPRKYTTVRSLINCSPNGTELYFKSRPNADCQLKKLSDKSLKCLMHCSECVSIPLDKSACPEEIIHSAKIVTHLGRNSSGNAFTVKDIDIEDKKMNTVCMVNVTFNCQALCEPVLQDCFVSKPEPEYRSEQFVLFLIFATLCVSFSGVATSFSDAICFNELGSENAHLYGKQRLWGTVGWGVFAPVAGIANDFSIYTSFLKTYQSGAILMLVVLFIDLYYVSQLRTENIKFSQSICKDVGKIISNVKILVFMLSVFVIGSFTALMWSFLFWHLGNIGGDRILFGLIPSVQCLIGELPYFFYAGTLIKKFGHFNILTISFIAFGFRFVGYSYISHPYMVLPLELLQGPTYGLFYATMASYANSVALPGTHTTVQGLISSAFEFGMAFGNLVGGSLMYKSGGAYLFFCAGIFSFIYGAVHVILSCIVLYLYKKPSEANEQEVTSPVEENIAFM